MNGISIVNNHADISMVLWGYILICYACGNGYIVFQQK